MGLFLSLQQFANTVGIQDRGENRGVTVNTTPSADAIVEASNPQRNGVATAAPADAAGILRGVNISNPKTLAVLVILGVGAFYLWKAMK